MGLPNVLEKVEKAGKELREELNRVDDALKLDPGNTDLLAEKQKLLAESVENTKNKLQLLKESQEQITQQYAAGDIDRGAYLEFQQELADTKQKLKELQQEQKDFGTVAQQVMEQAGTKVSEYGEKMSAAGNKMLPATAAIGALGAVAVNSGSDLIESQTRLMSRLVKVLKSLRILRTLHLKHTALQKVLRWIWRLFLETWELPWA